MYNDDIAAEIKINLDVVLLSFYLYFTVVHHECHSFDLLTVDWVHVICLWSLMFLHPFHN